MAQSATVRWELERGNSTHRQRIADNAGATEMWASSPGREGLETLRVLTSRLTSVPLASVKK